MEITLIKDFEFTHNSIDYIVDFDVYWYIVEEPRTYDHPGSYDLMIDSIAVLRLNYYDETTDTWPVSAMTDQDAVQMLLSYDQTIKSKITE